MSVLMNMRVMLEITAMAMGKAAAEATLGLDWAVGVAMFSMNGIGVNNNVGNKEILKQQMEMVELP